MLGWLRAMLGRKAFEPVLSAPTAWADAFQTQPRPTDATLVDEFKGVAYSCASLNAEAVARVPLKLYVQTSGAQAAPKCATKALAPRQEAWVRGRRRLAKAVRVEEVLEHPMLDLLERSNPSFGDFALHEITALYLEQVGSGYWWIERNALGVPWAVWILQPQFVSVLRDAKTNLVTGYEYGQGVSKKTYRAGEVVAFHFPNLTNPYGGGWSPAHAAFEAINLLNKDASYQALVMDRRARPDAVVSPRDKDSQMGLAQARRLETWFKRKFRQGGAGGVLVAEDPLTVTPLTFSSRDMEFIRRYGVNKVAILNAYKVPPALLDSSKTRAELEAALVQHGRNAVDPRCKRRDEAISRQLCPMYDPTGRLFVMSDDPVPEDRAAAVKVWAEEAKAGLRTINEIRTDEGAKPVPWGDAPWFPAMNVQPGTAPPPGMAEQITAAVGEALRHDPFRGSEEA